MIGEAKMTKIRTEQTMPKIKGIRKAQSHVFRKNKALFLTCFFLKDKHKKKFLKCRVLSLEISPMSFS